MDKGQSALAIASEKGHWQETAMPTDLNASQQHHILSNVLVGRELGAPIAGSGLGDTGGAAG
jgi:hypothetical protein